MKIVDETDKKVAIKYAALSTKDVFLFVGGDRQPRMRSMSGYVNLYTGEHVYTYRGGSINSRSVILLDATLTYKVNEDGTVSAGIAKCSDDDHYMKAAGRDLAASRLGQFTFPKGFNTRVFESNFATLLATGV